MNQIHLATASGSLQGCMDAAGNLQTAAVLDKNHGLAVRFGCMTAHKSMVQTLRLHECQQLRMRTGLPITAWQPASGKMILLHFRCSLLASSKLLPTPL